MGASCVRALLTETGKRKEEWWQPFFHLLPPSFHSFSPRMGRRTPAHTPPLRSTCTPPRAASRRGTGTPPNNSHRSTSEIGTVDHRSDDGRRRLRRQVGRSYSYMGRRRRRRGRQRRGGGAGGAGARPPGGGAGGGGGTTTQLSAAAQRGQATRLTGGGSLVIWQ
jgi:hypothetical protein